MATRKYNRINYRSETTGTTLPLSANKHDFSADNPQKQTAKRNILIVPPFNPYPLTSGGHQGVFNGIAILKDIANVYVLIDTTESRWKRGEDRELAQALPFVTILPFIDPASYHTLGWYCRTLRNKISYLLPLKKKEDTYNIQQPRILGVDDFRADKAAAIQAIIRRYKIDIVQAEMMANIRVIEYLPPSVKSIFVHHELRFVRDELAMRAHGTLNKELLSRLAACKNEELQLLNKYDEIVTMSSIDTEKLRTAGVTTHITTSLSAVTKAVVPTEKVAIRKVITYVDPENHEPNYIGVMWFLNNCWGKLRLADPDFTFQIIGKWTDDTAKYIASQYTGVTCVGFVENLADAIAGTTMIVPLNIGSGIRMKILEAAQIGVPVVTTTIGAEGLPLINRVHAAITDDADDFVDAILKLQDKSLRTKFVENPQRTIADKYSIEVLRENRKHLYC